MKSVSEFFANYRGALLGLFIVFIIGLFLGLWIGHRGNYRDFKREGCGFAQQNQQVQFQRGMMRGQFPNQPVQSGAVAQPEGK